MPNIVDINQAQAIGLVVEVKFDDQITEPVAQAERAVNTAVQGMISSASIAEAAFRGLDLQVQANGRTMSRVMNENGGSGQIIQAASAWDRLAARFDDATKTGNRLESAVRAIDKASASLASTMNTTDLTTQETLEINRQAAAVFAALNAQLATAAERYTALQVAQKAGGVAANYTTPVPPTLNEQERANNLPLFAHFGQTPVSGQFETQEGQGSLFPNLAQTFSPGATDPKQLLLFGAQEAARRKQQGQEEAAALVKDTATANTAVSSFLGGPGGPPLPITPSSGQGAGNIPAYGQRQEDLVAAQAAAEKLALTYDHDAASAAKLSAEVRNIVAVSELLGTEKAGRALNAAFDEYVVGAQKAEKAIESASAAEQRFLTQARQVGSVAASVSAAADQRLGAPRAPTGLSEAEAAQVNDVASRFIEKQNQSNRANLSPDLRDAAQTEALKQFRVELDAVTQAIERTRASTERMLDGLAEKFIPGVNAAKQFAATQADIQRLLEAGRVTQQQAADITVVQAAAYDKLAQSARAAAETIARTAENSRLSGIAGARPELLPGQSEGRQADVAAAFTAGDQVLASLSPRIKETQELEAKLEQIRYAERALGLDAVDAGRARSEAYKTATAAAAEEAAAIERARVATERLLSGLAEKYLPGVAAAKQFATTQEDIQKLLEAGLISHQRAADMITVQAAAYEKLGTAARAAAESVGQQAENARLGGIAGTRPELLPGQSEARQADVTAAFTQGDAVLASLSPARKDAQELEAKLEQIKYAEGALGVTAEEAGQMRSAAYKTATAAAIAEADAADRANAAAEAQLSQLQAKYAPAVAAANNYARALREIDDLLQRNKIDETQAADAVLRETEARDRLALSLRQEAAARQLNQGRAQIEAGGPGGPPGNLPPDDAKKLAAAGATVLEKSPNLSSTEWQQQIEKVNVLATAEAKYAEQHQRLEVLRQAGLTTPQDAAVAEARYAAALDEVKKKTDAQGQAFTALQAVQTRMNAIRESGRALTTAESAELNNATLAFQKTTAETEKGARSFAGAGYATSGLTRELVVMTHELSQGNISRFAGSVLTTTEYLTAFRDSLFSVGRALFTTTAGLASLGAVAVIGGITLLISQAHSASATLIDLQNSLRATREDYLQLAAAGAKSIHDITTPSSGVLASDNRPAIVPQQIITTTAKTSRALLNQSVNDVTQATETNLGNRFLQTDGSQADAIAQNEKLLRLEVDLAAIQKTTLPEAAKVVASAYTDATAAAKKFQSEGLLGVDEELVRAVQRQQDLGHSTQASYLLLERLTETARGAADQHTKLGEAFQHLKGTVIDLDAPMRDLGETIGRWLSDGLTEVITRVDSVIKKLGELRRSFPGLAEIVLGKQGSDFLHSVIDAPVDPNAKLPSGVTSSRNAELDKQLAYLHAQTELADLFTPSFGRQVKIDMTRRNGELLPDSERGRGVFQITPPTARGVINHDTGQSFVEENAAQNIVAGMKFFDDLFKQFKTQVDKGDITGVVRRYIGASNSPEGDAAVATRVAQIQAFSQSSYDKLPYESRTAIDTLSSSKFYNFSELQRRTVLATAARESGGSQFEGSVRPSAPSAAEIQKGAAQADQILSGRGGPEAREPIESAIQKFERLRSSFPAGTEQFERFSHVLDDLRIKLSNTLTPFEEATRASKEKLQADTEATAADEKLAQRLTATEKQTGYAPTTGQIQQARQALTAELSADFDKQDRARQVEAQAALSHTAAGAQGNANEIALAAVTPKERDENAIKAAQLVRQTAITGTPEQDDQLKRYTADLNLLTGAVHLYNVENDNTPAKQQKLRQAIADVIEVQRHAAPDSAAFKDAVLLQREYQAALNGTSTATQTLQKQQADSLSVQREALTLNQQIVAAREGQQAAARHEGRDATPAELDLAEAEVRERAARAFETESTAIQRHTQSLIAESNVLGTVAKGYTLLSAAEVEANRNRAQQIAARTAGDAGTPQYQRVFDRSLQQLNDEAEAQKFVEERKKHIPTQQALLADQIQEAKAQQLRDTTPGSAGYIGLQKQIEDLTATLYKLRTATEEVSHAQDQATDRARAGTGAQLEAFTAAQKAEEAARNEGKKAEEAAVIGLEAKRAKLVELTATFESQLATERKANDVTERGVAVLYQQYLAYGNIASAQEHLKNQQAARAEVLSKTASAADPAEVNRQTDLSTTEKDRKSQIDRESGLFPDLAKQREAITLEQAQIGALSGSIQKTNEAATAQKAKQELADKGFTQETALTDEYIRQAGVLGKLTNEYNFRKSSIEAVTNSLGQAFDQLGQSMSNAFLSGQSAGVNFHNAAKALVSSLLSEFAKLAVINPILNAIGIGEKKPTIFGALDALSGKQPAVSESRLGPATAQEIAAELEKSRQQQQQLSGPMNVTTPQVTINATGAVIHSSGTTGTTSDLPGPGPVPPPPPPLPSGSGYTSSGQPQYAANDIARAQDISGNNYTLSTPDTTIAIFATSAASLTAGQIRAPGIAAGAEGTIVGAGVSGGGESGAGTILVDRAVASSGISASQDGNAFDGSSGNLVIVQGQGQGQGVVDTGRFDVGSLSSGSSQQVVLMATESVPQGGSVDASSGSQAVPIASPGQGATTIISGGSNPIGNAVSLVSSAQRTATATNPLSELSNIASLAQSTDKLGITNIGDFFKNQFSGSDSIFTGTNTFGGQGPIFGGINRFLNTPLIGSSDSGALISTGFSGTSSVAFDTPAAAADFAGSMPLDGSTANLVFTPGAQGFVDQGAFDISGSGGTGAIDFGGAGGTIGDALGGVGLGFAGGSLLGTGVQSLLGKTGPGPEIGAGGGAIAGAVIGSIFPVIGTVVGAIVGGLIGGAGGGLIGPKPPSPFSSTYVGVNNAGQLDLGASVSQMINTDADRAAANVEIAKTNAILTNNGLRITDVVGVDAPGRALNVNQGDQTSFQIGQNSPKGPIDPSKFADFATAFASFRFAPTTQGVTSQFFEGHSFASPEELDKVTQALNTFVAALKGTPGESFTQNFLGQVSPMANTDIPGRLQQIQTFVTDTVPQLTNTGALSQSIAGLNSQYSAAIALAHQLGYAEQALTDSRDAAIKKAQDTAAFNLQQVEVGNTARFSTAYDTVNAGVGTSFTPGNLRAQQATQLYSFDNATAPQARKNLTDTLVATYGDAYKQSQSFADEMALLEKTLGEERLALVTQSNNNILAATKANDTASFGISQTDVGLNLRYQSATDTLNSGAPGSAAQIDAQKATALATFDLATAPTQRKQLTDQLTAFYGDAYTSTAGYAAQLALLEKTLGQERLAVAKSFDDQIAGQTKQSQNNVYQVSQSLLSYARNLGNSVLSPQQQYANAQQDFQQQATLAQGGDFQAIQNLTGYADTFISTSRALFGSGAQYFQNVGAVLAVLNNIATTPAETLTADAFALIQKQTLLDQTNTLMGGLTQLSTLLGNILAQMQISPLIPGRLIGNT